MSRTLHSSVVPQHRAVPHALHRRSSTLVLGAVALLLTSALPAVAQDGDPLAKLDVNSRNQVQSLIDSAEAVGIPSHLLLLKALEGMAKHADNRKIVLEVRKEFGWLESARAAIGPVDENELGAAAAVLKAGGKPEQLAEFRLRQRGRSDIAALTIWADFIGRGVPRDEAFSAINKLWHDGADDATFNTLFRNVQADILQGLNPGAALQNRIREGPMRGPTGAVKPPESPQENQSSE